MFVLVALFSISAVAAGTEDPEKAADSKTRSVTVERAEGKYPEILRRFNVEGDGLVRTTVTNEGQLTDIKVTQSPHPAFEYAMVQVLLASKFTPAMKEGVPIQQGVVLPFRFRFEGSGKRELSRYDAPFAFPSKASPDLPAALQYDVPPGMKVVAPVVYPRHLFEHGSFGRARVVVSLDRQGLVRNVKVLEATHPDFGEATRAMLFAWEFTPAMKDGKAIPASFTYQQEFSVAGRDTWTSQVIKRLMGAIADKSAEVVEFDALDKRPVARYQPPPVDPRAGDAPAEDVVVEFFIDPDGGVQLPTIKSANNAELGWAAATAVKRWIFEPPTVNGKPVFARSELQFTFK